MDEPDIVDAVDADDAFGVLSDETRIEVLRALWDAEDREATFSELRDAVGMRDSGQFNYHLGTFDGQFVAETEDGYRLTTAGAQLVGALLSGAYTQTLDVDTVEMADDCPRCGSSLSFTYDDGTAEIGCDDCPHVNHFLVPPGAFAGYDAQAYPRVAARYGRKFVRSSRDGFCPLCDGRMAETVLPLASTVEADDVPAWVENVPTCRFDCERCGEVVVADLGTTLAEHPAVVSFHHERGVDVSGEPLWRFTALDTDSARFERRDPVRASVTYEAGGDELAVTVDESLSVVETTIEPGTGG